MKTRTRTRLIVVLVAAAAAVGVAVWALTPRLSLAAAPQIPTARVTRGNLEVNVHLVGELQTGRMASLVPPPAGVPLRLIRLAATGDAVTAGDIVMAFDPADQEYSLEQSQSTLLEAEQEIIRLRANTEVQASQSAVDLLTARFDVRRAEMDALTPAQLVGAIEARTRSLRLDETKRRLAELDGSSGSREAVDRAALLSLEQRRNTARAGAQRAQAIIDQLEVAAPFDGSIVVRENRDGTTFFFTGMTLPEYRIGDTVLQGRPTVDVIDTREVRVRARVSEQDRPNLAPGLKARVFSDALGGDWLTATVDTVGGLANRSPMDGQTPIRRFDVSLRLDQPERLRPGTSVRIVVSGQELTDVLHVPRQAVFVENDEPFVYVRTDGQFVQQKITIAGRTEGRVAVEGVFEGADVALLDPSKVEQTTTTSDAVLQ